MIWANKALDKTIFTIAMDIMMCFQSMTSYKGSNTTINAQQVPSHNTFDQDTTTNPKSWGGLLPFQVENDVELLVKEERRSEAIPVAVPLQSSSNYLL
jgi:hypothetical protein